MIQSSNDRTIIKYNETIFYLYEIYNVEDTMQCYKLSKKVAYFNCFVLNIFQDCISKYDNRYFVLLMDNEKTFDLCYLFSLYRLDTRVFLNWRNLWIEKCDYVETYYSTIKGKYPIVDESIDYYLSMAELAIYYLKEYNDYYDFGFIQHKIIDNDLYFNSLNLKVDVKERDFAEYLKFIFFSGGYPEINVSKLIKTGKNIFNYELVVARLLFPNYYFNLLDDIILLKRNPEDLASVITRTNEYEEYISFIVEEINEFCSIKKISFQ